MYKGFYATIEGIDGAGKTTVIPLIVERLTKEIDNITNLLPITELTKVTPTLDLLHQHFTFNNISDVLLKLLPLPEPSWEIFNQTHEY